MDAGGAFQGCVMVIVVSPASSVDAPRRESLPVSVPVMVRFFVVSDANDPVGDISPTYCPLWINTSIFDELPDQLSSALAMTGPAWVALMAYPGLGEEVRKSPI